MHLRLQSDSLSFHPVHTQIRAFGPRDLHHAKGRGQSVSFSNRSNLCIGYACRSRNKLSPGGVVIAVRFPSLEGRRIVREQWGIYLFEMEFQPEVVGYCMIPATYQFK